jgi:hypothetical protein
MAPLPICAASIPVWRPPWPTEQGATFTRVSAAHLTGESRWLCPEQVAAKARPEVRPLRDRADKPTYSPYDAMPLGIIRTAIFEMLRHGLDAERGMAIALEAARSEVTAEAQEVVRRGIEGYLQVLTQLHNTGALTPDTIVREYIALEQDRDHLDGRVEWYGWGVCHISRDSQVREYHLLTWSDAGRRQRSAASLGVYAHIAADAVCVQEGGWWSDASVPTDAQPRAGAQVRIREIGVLDATSDLRFSGTVDDARALFLDAVPPALEILAGGDYNPGSHCASCAVRPECTGIARIPGLLGVAGPATWTRALSPGDLATANVCGHRVFLSRTLGLPAQRSEPTEAMQRGTDIHTWLEYAHGRREACTPEDVPLDGLGPIAELLGWDSTRYLALRPYLVAHVQQCPLLQHPADDAYPEMTLTAWDTDADVIVSTRADLVIAHGDSIILRETKTVMHVDTELTDAQLLDRYPQLALSLCLLADGVNPISNSRPPADQPPRGTVEVEFLEPDQATVRRFDVADPEIVLLARTSVAEATDRLLYGSTEPTVGKWCSWCPVAQWCTAQHDASEHTFTEDSGAALLVLAETLATGQEEDIPF